MYVHMHNHTHIYVCMMHACIYVYIKLQLHMESFFQRLPASMYLVHTCKRVDTQIRD